MLTRRHIRVKVMQSLYALLRKKEANVPTEEKFLRKSMADTYDLFLLNLSLLMEVKSCAGDYYEKSKKKHLATEADINPNLKFVENKLIDKLENCEELQEALEQKKLFDWRKESHYAQQIWKNLRESELYEKYIATRTHTFKEDQDFLINFFKEIVAPNEKLHDYFEDAKLTWVDDLPIVNTAVVKTLRKEKAMTPFALPQLFKSDEDRDFAFSLFRNTLEYYSDFDESINQSTLNWDKDRLADIDRILMRMGLCEFVYFPTIPVKATINEYLEISKEYSTPKSSVFINGVLDKLSKSYKKEGRLNKTGRGLN